MRRIHRGPVNSPHKGPVTWNLIIIFNILLREMAYNTTGIVSHYLEDPMNASNGNTPHQSGHCSASTHRSVFKMDDLIARFIGPTWGLPGADRTQVGPMLAPLSLLYGMVSDVNNNLPALQQSSLYYYHGPCQYRSNEGNCNCLYAIACNCNSLETFFSSINLSQTHMRDSNVNQIASFVVWYVMWCDMIRDVTCDVDIYYVV